MKGCFIYYVEFYLINSGLFFSLIQFDAIAVEGFFACEDCIYRDFWGGYALLYGEIWVCFYSYLVP